MLRVCDPPAAPLVRSIAVPAAAFDALDASLIVLWSSLIIKYEPSARPPIAVPPPSLYVTFCPVTNQ